MRRWSGDIATGDAKIFRLGICRGALESGAGRHHAVCVCGGAAKYRNARSRVVLPSPVYAIPGATARRLASGGITFNDNWRLIRCQPLAAWRRNRADDREAMGASPNHPILASGSE